MPELPEVETVRRGVEPAVTGRTVRAVRFTPQGERLLQGISPTEFSDYLIGRRFEALNRRGKYLVFVLDDGRFLIAHLRMTGRLEVEPTGTEEGQFFRAAITLDDGNELRWRDVRRFGTWEVAGDLSALLCKLGPEPLEDDYLPSVLSAALTGRHAPIKSVLLDQRRVAGMGNIYVDEALHRAQIHPRRPAGSLSEAEVLALHAAMREVLQKGIHNSGTTLRDYVNAYGQEGRNQEHLNVYQRTGLPCHRCGTGVSRIVVAGRGTHFCPDCQPAGDEAVSH